MGVWDHTGPNIRLVEFAVVVAVQTVAIESGAVEAVAAADIVAAAVVACVVVADDAAAAADDVASAAVAAVDGAASAAADAISLSLCACASLALVSEFFHHPSACDGARFCPNVSRKALWHAMRAYNPDIWPESPP